MRKVTGEQGDMAGLRKREMWYGGEISEEKHEEQLTS